MNKVFPILIFILFLQLSCQDNPIDNNGDNLFSVEIEVVDSTGNLIPNIQVSIWSIINNQSNLNKLESLNNINAATTIPFQIVQRCYTDLTLYDLNNTVFTKLVTGLYDAGMYEVNWSTLSKNGVYKCVLTASSDSQQTNVLFKDSIYMSLISPDPNVSVVGITDNKGKAFITDKLLFPHLFNLPLIPRTLEGGPEIVGYVSYSDSVVIAISNETFSKTVMFNRIVVDGQNKFRFVLNNNFLKLEKDNINVKKNFYNTSSAINSISSPDTVVLLTSFTATAGSNRVELSWITASETNNQGFEIQRKLSLNQNWETIGFVEGHGTTNEAQVYSFTDQNVFPETFSYRLKQIDFDGNYSYSQEIEVDVPLALEWKLYQNYPNPFN